MKELKSLHEKIHSILINRFCSGDGVIYDYAGLAGEVILPTPDDCGKKRPNALGWMSPIEDGAFFSGDFLLGLYPIYRAYSEDSLKETIRNIVAGLYHLQDVCRTPGCIARGTGSDGTCHYPASSNDQVFPWLLALREYLKSGIPNREEQQECRSRMLGLLTALKENQWIIPGDIPGFERGSFLNDANDLECHLSSIHILTATMILEELQGTHGETDHYANQILRNGKRRVDFLAEGFSNLEHHQCWYTSHSVYAMREMSKETKNAELRDACLAALKSTGHAAARHLSHWEKYDGSQSFSPDWRPLNDCWTLQRNCIDAQECARLQNRKWRELSPVIEMEKQTVIPSLAAAWIVLLSNDQELIRNNVAQIFCMVSDIQYNDLYNAAFLFAENVIGELMGLHDYASFSTTNREN